jgi:hypothetical protein
MMLECKVGEFYSRSNLGKEKDVYYLYLLSIYEYISQIPNFAV